MNNEEKRAFMYLKNTTDSFLDYPFVEIAKSQFSKYDFLQISILLNLIEKQNKKIENAIKFIEDGNNYFEDGENWENVLKIKDILEGTDE